MSGNRRAGLSPAAMLNILAAGRCVKCRLAARLILRSQDNAMQLLVPPLLLRDYTAADGPAMLAYQRDPRYLRYYPWSERTAAEVCRLLQLFRDWQEEQPRRRFQLAIVLAAEGRLIGSCGLRRNPQEDQAADLGYELNPDYWGRGYATAAARAMVNFGFKELGLQRIAAWCLADNAAAARVLARLGFRRAGLLPRNEYFKGRYWDTLLFALTAAEWAEQEQRRESSR